jgi:hypothetical protein
MEREALKLALEALEESQTDNDTMEFWDRKIKAITAIKEALAQPAQEPVAWRSFEATYSHSEALDIRMGDGSILCNVLPQSDGDLWWDGSGTGEKFIDPKYADVTHWRIHSNTTPPKRERVLFPTMLRKMWSGGEVQAWLDENVNKEKNG